MIFRCQGYSFHLLSKKMDHRLDFDWWKKWPVQVFFMKFPFEKIDEYNILFTLKITKEKLNMRAVS